MLDHYYILSESAHSLLDRPAPAYSRATVRRALTVWLHCGQQNEFRQVCDYFHRLETLESELSEEDRTASRHLELKLLSSFPPTSNYLLELFPKLYQNKINFKKINDINLVKMKIEDCVFNLEGFHDMKIQKDTTPKDILRASQLIIMFSKNYLKPLKVLLAEFQDFVKKTQSTNSVNNISMYIKNKYVKDELETWKNMPRNFSFLEDTEDVTAKIAIKNDKSPINTKKIRILINESRGKEHLNIIPNFAELSIKQRANSTSVLAVKLKNMPMSEQSKYSAFC